MSCAYVAVMVTLGLFTPWQLLGNVAILLVLLVLSGVVHLIQPSLSGGALLALLILAEIYFGVENGLQAVQVANLTLILVLSALLFRRVGIVVSVILGSGVVGGVLTMHGAGSSNPFVEWLTVSSILSVIGVLLGSWLVAERESRRLALRSADALVEQERRYAELVRNAPDGVLAVGSDGLVEAISPAVSNLLRFDEADVLGRRVWDFPGWTKTGREGIQESFRKALESGRPQTVVAELAGGVPAWLEVRTSLVRRLDGGLAVHATLRDVSERELAQRAQRAYREGLAQAERVELLGRLAGGVAHDFNNLLSVIITNAELIADRQELEDAEELHDLRAAAAMGADLTRKLMALTRVEQLELASLDVSEVLRELRPVLRSVLPSSVQLRVSVAADLPRVQAGHAQLEQLLVNLVINARDAMPEGGRVSIEARENAGGG